MANHETRRLYCAVLGSVLALLASSTAASGQTPTAQQRDAIRQACGPDYQAVCAGVPTGGRPALSCLQRNAGNLSPPCREALASVQTPSSEQAPRPTGGLRQACRADYRRFCTGTRPGGGHIIGCLKANAPSLSPDCQQALMNLRH